MWRALFSVRCRGFHRRIFAVLSMTPASSYITIIRRSIVSHRLSVVSPDFTFAYRVHWSTRFALEVVGKFMVILQRADHTIPIDRMRIGLYNQFCVKVA